MIDLYDEIKDLRARVIKDMGDDYCICCDIIIRDLGAILSRHEKPEPSAPQNVERWRCKECGLNYPEGYGLYGTRCTTDGVEHWNSDKQRWCGPVERVEETPKPIEFMDRPYAKRGEK